MDAAQALADLTEISSQIRAAVLFDEAGEVVGSTLGDDGRARELVEAATELLEGARALRSGEEELTQVDAATSEGSVFVVVEGARRIVATTGPQPTVGLVFYDLKSCLRASDEDEQPAPEGEQPKKRRAPRKKNDAKEAGDPA